MKKIHHIAVLLSGTKPLALFIFRKKILPKDKSPHGILVHVHPKDWRDEEDVKLWLDKGWSKHSGALLKNYFLYGTSFIAIKRETGLLKKGYQKLNQKWQ